MNEDELFFNEWIKLKYKNFLIKQLNDALELIDKMKTDKMLRIVYSDIDWNRYVEKRRNKLREFWDDIEIENTPFAV
jgi:hypothetical protein